MTKKFETVLARTQEDLEAVGRLRYKCYVSEGQIEPRAEETFLDEYDFAEGVGVYMVLYEGQIVGTMRLHILDKEHKSSATMASFSDLLEPKLSTHPSMIDAARFAIDPDMGALRLGIAVQLLRLYARVSKEHAVKYGVAAVPSNRISFYKRLYGFECISEPRDYADLSKKLVLLGVDLS